MDTAEKANMESSKEIDKNSEPSNVAQKQPVRHIVKRRKTYKPRTTKLSRCKNGISKIDPKKFSCALPDISSPSKSEIEEKQPEVQPVRRIHCRPFPTNVVRYTMTPRQGQLKLTRYHGANSVRPKPLKVRNVSSPRKSTTPQGVTNGSVRFAPVQTVVTKLAFMNPRDPQGKASSKRRDTSASTSKDELEVSPSGAIGSGKNEADSGLQLPHMKNHDTTLQDTRISRPYETRDVSNLALRSEYFLDNDDDFLDILLWLHGEKETREDSYVNQTEDDGDTDKWLKGLIAGFPGDKHQYGRPETKSFNKAIMLDSVGVFSENRYTDTHVNVLNSDLPGGGSDETCPCQDESFYDHSDNVFDIEAWLDEQKRIITGEGCQHAHIAGDEPSLKSFQIEGLSRVSENVHETYSNDFLDFIDFSDLCHVAEKGIFNEIEGCSSPNNIPETVSKDDWLCEHGFDVSPVIQNITTCENYVGLRQRGLWLADETVGLGDSPEPFTPSSIAPLDDLNTGLRMSDGSKEINLDSSSLDKAFNDLLSELRLGERECGSDGTCSVDNIANVVNADNGHVKYTGTEDFYQSQGSVCNTLEVLRPDLYYDLDRFLSDLNSESKLMFGDTYDFYNDEVERYAINRLPYQSTLEESVKSLMQLFGIDCNTDIFVSELDNSSDFVQPKVIYERICLPGIESEPTTVNEREDLVVAEGLCEDETEVDQGNDSDDLESIYLKGRLSIHTRRLSSEDMICRISCIFHEFTLNDDLTYRTSQSGDCDDSLYGTPEDDTCTHDYITDDLSCLPLSSNLYRLSTGHWYFDVPVF